MRTAAFIAIGLIFILMGVGLFALTLRKGKEIALPTKAQLRERAALAEENQKMRIAAGVAVGAGVILGLFSFLF
jgi:uncharacterized protein YjeT (DUF2065 family)